LEVQPTARLLWTPTKRQSVWAAASRAVRTRTFTEDDAQFTAVPFPPTALPRVRTVANRSLNPEEVWAYEMGYRIQPTDAFTVDTALFYNVYDQLRINRSNPALASTLPAPLLAASQFDNGMNGETYGAELSATLRLTDWWRLSGSYTVLKMNLHRDTDLGPATEAAEGQSPQQQAFLQSSWSLPGDVDFDLIGRYVDRLSGFNPGGLPGVSDTVPAYVSLDVRLSWRPRKNLELSLVGQNLLDNHHPEFGTNPFVRSPLVEIRRGVYAMVKLEF
jgi:iron complex outermembrane recepter protein